MKLTLKTLAKKYDKLEARINLLSPQPKPSRFIDNDDGTIIDKETNLVWQKEDDGVTRTWEEAKEYCENNKAKLPGEGWRTPTVKELISIVDYDKHDPAIYPVFTKTRSSYYWSDTAHADGAVCAWFVFFGNGVVNYGSRGDHFFVRAVRQNSR